MKRALFVILFLLTSLGSGLANPANNNMVVGAKEEPVLLGDFWGFAGNTASASDVENYLWAALEYTDIDGNDQPYLATEVPTTKNGRVIVTDLGKGKKRIDIHYTLRDGIYWSDGVPITSEDVRFFYEVGKYPGAPVANPDYWQRVSLKVQDERNFTVSFEPAYFYDLIGPAIGLAPAHTMRPAWEKAKKALSGLNSEKDAKKIAAVCRNFVLKTGSPQALNRGSLVYSGPFVLQKWAPGKLEMTRNPRFLITPPGGSGHYLKRVTYQFYEDRDALNVALISGRLDATTITALTLKEALSPQLTRRLQGRYQIWAVPGPIWEHLEVNKFTEVRQVRELLLDDPRTRQALLYAINRKGLTEAFFDGLQPMADTWVNPQNPAYDSEVRRYPYDPEKARQLLTSLGWSDLDGDGYLERRNNDGRIVSFVLEYTTTSDNQERLRIQDFVRSNLEKVGIKVSVVNVPSTVAFSQEFLPRAASGRWRGLFEFAWLLDLGDDASLYTCHDAKSGKILLPEKSNGYIGYNFGWCNNEFDHLRNRALVEFDEEKRREYWKQMQKIWANELPALPLYWRSNALVVRKGLVNYVSSTYFGGLGYPSTTAWLIGWRQNGAQQVYDQAIYGRRVLP